MGNMGNKVQIVTHLTREERQQVKDAAKAASMSMNTYVLFRLGVITLEDAKLIGEGRRRGGGQGRPVNPLPSDIVATISEMKKQINDQNKRIKRLEAIARGDRLQEHYAHPNSKMEECPDAVTVVDGNHLVSLSKEEWLLAENERKMPDEG